jgi:hypothetical protein
MARDRCGATCGPLVCDRAPHTDGDHRGYDEEHDAVLFWPTTTKRLEELKRTIRIVLAAVEPARRAATAEHLYDVIADAIGSGGRA